MSQLVKISFYDAQNWINSEAEKINWDNASEFYKDEEVTPWYLPPQIFADKWNGLEHDVQHLRWDVFRLEIFAQSSELIELSRIQSCDTVLIQDINSGKTIQTVDMQKSEWLSFAEPERVSNTSSWKLVLIYRTNKTIINKFDGLTNQVVVIGGSGTYNSKYKKIPFDSPIEQLKIAWGEDGKKLLQETQKSGSQVLFYMNKSDKDALNQDWGQNDFTIDGADVISAEKLTLEITNLGEDNYKIILTGITTRDTTDKTTALATLFTVVGAFTQNCKFERISNPTSSEKIGVDWPDGSIRLLQEIVKVNHRVLLYLTTGVMQQFNSDWGSSAFVIAGSNVIEKYELEISVLESGYYQVIIPYSTGPIVTNYDLTPLNTHELVITDTGGPYTFHTDYATEPDVPDAEKDPINNEDGLPVDAKIISRQVTDIKLFLNTADKNSLKLHYEKGSAATIDTVAILYRGIVETNPLAKDLWEVDIVGLTTTPLVTNPL